MKILTKLRYFFLPSALILHIALIFIRGYFLSAEFTLYPYLVGRGFAPYRDLVDQHFPTLFFGPLSLPSFLTANPGPLLGVFLATLCLTDFFLYLSLLRFNVKRPLVWLIFYIVSSVYFSGYILWIETFVNLLLSLWLFLSFSQNSLRRFVSGLLLSQIILLRPTMAPAILVLIISFSGLSWALIAGGAVGLAIPALFVIKQGIVPDFFRLVVQFNKEVYPQEARLSPLKREITILLLWLTPVFFSLIKNKKFQYLAVLLLLLPLAFPRFGYEHLQPLYFLGILFWALQGHRPRPIVYFLIFILFAFNLAAGIRHHYGNFYLNQEVKEAAIKIKELPVREIYLLGAPDLLYQLSGKMPPYYTYVPSLPWYLHQKDFQEKIITSLKKTKPIVIIDPRAEVDNQNILTESQSVFEYIKMNYKEGGKMGSYQLYLPEL